MFSLTLFISNLSFLKKANAYSFISIPILLGIFFSPDQGLIPILPSTLDNLTWAIKVALTWITFLAGTRLSKINLTFHKVRQLLPFLMAYLVFLFTSIIVVQTFGPSAPKLFDLNIDTIKVITISLLLSSVLFSSKENPFLLPIFFVSLLYLFNDTIYKFTYMDLIFPLALGTLMGAVCRLIVPPQTNLDTPTRLTLLGLCTLGTGWAIGIGNLEVLVGLAFGWTMAFIHKFKVCDDPKMTRTAIPLKFIVSLFSGMYITLSLNVIIIGVLLALARFALKTLILNIGFRKASAEEVLTTIIPISQLALPITLSLHLSKFSNDDTSFILGCFCVGFIVNDILALILELIKKENSQSQTSKLQPRENPA